VYNDYTLKTLTGSLIFSIFVPGTFFLLVPYLLFARGQPLRAFLAAWTGYSGLVVGAVGIWIYLWAMASFLTRGQGTPAPSAPPVHFVAAGPYRYVRNPMYLSGMVILAAEALLFRSVYLLVFMGVLLAAFHTFVVRYEEPHLRRRFGAEYERYLERVPRWLPIKKGF